MTYLPSEDLNQNYHYYSNGTYFTIKTNNNCYNSYNSYYCDCYYIYPEQDYLRSNTFSCVGSSSSEINYNNFSSALSYRLDFDKILIIIFIILFAMIYLLSALCHALFKGVFK